VLNAILGACLQNTPNLVAWPSAKGKALKNLGGFKGVNKKPTKQPPDTSRIPWFPPLPKTGTDA